MSDPFPAIPEAAASGETADLLADIRATVGVRVVNLVWRHLATFRPGDRAVLAETPWGVLGMTICYDLRFPYLYRDLAHAGATLLAIPSSFTVPTGQAHWHVLLRARAIEAGCFLIAAAQAGEHQDGRTTYGHSLVVDPWAGLRQPKARSGGKPPRGGKR